MTVAVFILLHRRLNTPCHKELALEKATYALRSKYPDVVIGEQLESWCNGLCGVCEEDCDDDHVHNFKSHCPGEHLEITLLGDAGNAQEASCLPQE